MTRVAGLDPSLTAFGMAAITDGAAVTDTIKTKLTGHRRLAVLLETAADVALGSDLTVIEGLSFGAKGNAMLDLAGLHWLLRHMLWEHDLPYVVIPPALLKKWITGSGNASKDEVLIAAIKRFPMAEISGNNEADALTLAAMGAGHLGIPLAPMPKDRTELLYSVNRKGYAQIPWPTREGT